MLFVFALGLTAAGSWAFYPKAAFPAAYLTVIGSGRPGTNSSIPELTTIQPDGQLQVQHLPHIKVSSERGLTATDVELQ